jgi:hypothetical protein
LFNGPVVWRGIVYAILMAIAKCATGCWLKILPASTKFIGNAATKKRAKSQKLKSKSKVKPSEPPAPRVYEQTTSSAIPSVSDVAKTNGVSEQTSPSPEPKAESDPPPLRETTLSSVRHKNLYPALLLGFSMTTRGEIGFLIAAIAQSSSILAPSEVYLVVLYGILLCTLFGPIGVGVVARRIENVAHGAGGRDAVLGGWGEPERRATGETER